MLATHHLSKSIKTQITLSFQRSNITFDIIRCNSSSFDSSDSDSKSGHSFSSTITNKQSKSFKGTKYLQNANKNERKIRMVKVLSKTAKLLTTTSKVNKQEIMSNLLNDIKNIQNMYDNVPKRQEKFTNTKVQNNTQNVENKFKKEFSIIKMLKNQKQQNLREESFQIKNKENQNNQTGTFIKRTSVLQSLKDNQEIQAKLVQRTSVLQSLKDNQETQAKLVQRTSVPQSLKDNQETEAKLVQRTSVLQSLKDKQETEAKLVQRTSVLQSLKDKQETQAKLVQRTSVLQSLKDNQETEAKLVQRTSVLQSLKDNQETQAKLVQRTSVLQLLKDDQETQAKLVQKTSVLQSLKDNQEIQATLIKKQHARNNNLNRNETNYKFETRKNVMKESHINKAINQNTFGSEIKATKFKVSLFHDFVEAYDSPKFKIWDEMENRKLHFIKDTFITNAFEEMIGWTEEGKLWKFPIDNEQGMEKEQSVHFSKHVFLERHLIPWCPTKGPVRHFMELVCTGLSNNPYMTFEEKYDHIMWYKNYFQDKQDLLQDLGAIE